LATDLLLPHRSSFFSGFLSTFRLRLRPPCASLAIGLTAAALVLSGCSGNSAGDSSTKTATTTTPLAITTTSLPNGEVGAAYSVTLGATGGTNPYTWSVSSGTLPAGLALSASSGAITGTPTTAVSAAPLTFTVTDSSSPSQTKSLNLTLTISASGTAPLTVTTTTFPNGQVGAAYSATLTATGGTTPYTWTLTAGTLPAGLSLNAGTGVITGTPTAAANATPLTFTVTDSSSPVQTQAVSLTLTISASGTAPLTVTTTALPNGQVGTSYSATLTATGGTTPYSWALTAGTLPAGLSLNASTGAISGTPTAAASATPLSFTVTDSSSPAQNKAVNLTLSISAAATLTISTSSLPNGQEGTAYTATLSATGGTAPYKWSLTSGTLPAGLTLSQSGTVTGTPSATANATPLTFSISDSSTPVETGSATLALNISPMTITVSVSPTQAGIAITQALSLTPTTNDYAGVTWSASGSGCSGSACGTFSANTSQTGTAVTYTAPNTAGNYTITATSTTNGSVSAAVTLGVTDLAGVTTYHNNLSRNGTNTQEYLLNSGNVTSSTFGKLFSCTVDEAIYAQPLWMPNITIGSAKHNIVVVATMNDSLYAFDADNNSTPCTPLWHANLLDSAHGGTSGETSVPSGPANHLVGYGNGDIMPEVGVLGTPVIDPTTNTVYAVSKSVIASGPTFFQRLHAIDLTTGNEKFSGPASINATYPGTKDGTMTTTFVAGEENQRCGLALVNGVVYIAWAAHEDAPPFYGWVVGYNAGTLQQVSVLNDDPNAGQGGIWMSGGAPAADSSGNLYLITGNGTFDASNASAPNNDYGDSFMQLSSGLDPLQYFTPSDQQSDEQNDQDFGAGGAAVLIDLPANGTNPTHLVVGGGKDGSLYVLNRDKLGGYGDSNAWQKLSVGLGIYSTPAFWNSTLYLAPSSAHLQAFSLSASTAQLTVSANSTPETFPFLAPTPSISSMPNNSNGIVWALDNTNYCTTQAPSCGPSILHAYSATNLTTEYWNSSQGTGNTGGNAVKFTVPTVANGKVYVGTRGNNAGGADSSTSIPGELDVYGLIP
jgi:Putative Ig domain